MLNKISELSLTELTLHSTVRGLSLTKAIITPGSLFTFCRVYGVLCKKGPSLPCKTTIIDPIGSIIVVLRGEGRFFVKF